MKERLISVIVPIYNVESYIEKSIDSLLKQDYKNFEVLLIDDGSTDRSCEVARSLIGSDERFKFFSKENGGLSDARNYGIDRAEGEFLAFLDSDDYYSTSFLRIMAEKLNDSKVDIVICDLDLVRVDGSYIRSQKSIYANSISGRDAFQDNLQTKSIISMAQNKLYRRSLFCSVRYPKGLYYEDRCTTYKLFLKSRKVAFVNESLFYYLQREGSIMNGLSDKKLDDKFIVLELIRKYLKEEGEFQTYKKEYALCYLLNVVVSGSVQIAMYSDEYSSQLAGFLSRVDKRFITIESIMNLASIHPKKALALLLLLVSKRAFKYFSVSYKKGYFTNE